MHMLDVNIRIMTQLAMKIDVVIPVKTSLVSLVIDKTIPSVLSKLQHRQIFIITRKENFKHFLDAFKDQIGLLDEDEIVEGLTLNKVKSYLISKQADEKRAGWYFQQFLKLGISKSNIITDLFLIWDADCVALRPISFVSNDNKVLCDTTKEHHEPYFDTIERLIGIKKQVDHSFISEHFVFNKDIASALLDQITNEKNWWIEILNNIEPSMLSHSGFSEYELYGNYVTKYHPDHFKIRKLRKTRNGTKLLGMNPSSKSLSVFSKVFDYISFEEWQDKYKPLPIRYLKIIKVLLTAKFKN